jgi:molybdopterin-guanine dinucleotide biosynthesis protein A
MLSVVIQAGGRSSRMGQDKAFVRLAGKALIEHVLARVSGLGDETLITTNDPKRYARFGLRAVPDSIPGAGALQGLRTALASAGHERVLLVACDMPFLQRPLLDYILGLAGKGDVIVPVPGGRHEPLLALYQREVCLRAVDQVLQAGERRMISFYPAVHVVEIDDARLDELDPARISFFNVNNPDDVRRAEGMLASLQTAKPTAPPGGTKDEV